MIALLSSFPSILKQFFLKEINRIEEFYLEKKDELSKHLKYLEGMVSCNISSLSITQYHITFSSD
jgi:hypothetical protein